MCLKRCILEKQRPSHPASIWFEMAELLHHSLCKFTFTFTFNSAVTKTKRDSTRPRKLNLGPIGCVLSEANRRTLVKNGKDSLDICRVVNGMWQTSGGWGRIDQDNATDAMLKYADAGLTTFDMADICILLMLLLTVCIMQRDFCLANFMGCLKLWMMP